jgi:hypothetical protein
MITFEELSARFPVQNVAPYGECVVVPGAEFDPDWEVYLGDQGCRCRFTDLDQRPVVLVQRKNALGAKEIVVYKPKEKVGGEKSMENKENKKFRGFQKGPSWSPEEEQRLLKRMGELHGTITERTTKLTPEFKRSASGLEQKFKRLLRAQKEPKHERRKPGPKPKIATKSLQSSDKVAEKSTESTQTGSGSEPDLSAEKKIEETRVDVLAVAIDDLSEAIIGLKEKVQEVQEEQRRISKALSNHKHARSGEAMLPMEASK